MYLEEGDFLNGSFFEPRSGVYAIVHKKSHKAYIGQSKNILRRWVNHAEQLSRGAHDNSLLQDAWEQEGAAGLYFEILEFCEPDRLLEREFEYVKAWHWRWGVFNKRLGGWYDIETALNVLNPDQTVNEDKMERYTWGESP